MTTDLDLDLLIDAAVVAAELEFGKPASWLANRGFDACLLAVSDAAPPPPTANANASSPNWTADEDEFLIANQTWLTDAEVGDHLGRSADAVKLRRQRTLGLPGVTKHDHILTAGGVIRLLGIGCGKSVSNMIRRGILPGRQMAADRLIWAVDRTRLERWMLQPENWIYFDPAKVTDPRLASLLARQAERWGDAWWTTGQVAAYHGVDSRDVHRYISRGEIPAVCWGNWRVRRSHATAPDLIFYQGKGGATKERAAIPTRADAFYILATAIGLSTGQAGLLADCKGHRIGNRLYWLRTNDLMADTIRALGLADVVDYDPSCGLLYADWRLHARRFPAITRAMARYAAARPLRTHQARLVFAVLRNALAWHGRADAELAARAAALSHGVSSVTVKRCRQVQAWLADLGVDVLESEER